MIKPKSQLLIEIDKQIERHKSLIEGDGIGYVMQMNKIRELSLEKQGILAQMKDELEFLENEIDGINSILTEEAVNKRISDLKHDINLNGVGK